MKRKHLKVLSFSLIAATIVVVVLIPIQVCRDWGFVCEYTGSRKGYREWTFGLKTVQWYEKSPLEEFVQNHAPNRLSHRWTSSKGTGRNIFGRPMLRGHGRPGAVTNFLYEFQKQWIAKHDIAEVLQLYDLLVSDDQAKIEVKIESIIEEIMTY